MNPVLPDQFQAFFEALHNHPPYSWQKRLAATAVEGQWPGAIDLPTGSGKTACIDIAIFALACQASRPVPARTAPRRIVFCVNRRVIVDEAHQRARAIARQLWEAERDTTATPSVLRNVAAALRHLAGTRPKDDIPPLDVLELRGGIYRDNRWARSAAQPTVLCSTIDQIGSRLLFRGYGVSPNAAPVQAALLAYDSLILLDEAHISKPFLETLANVQGLLQADRWAEQSIGARPMTVVPMTATPPEGIDRSKIIRLDEIDQANPVLQKRLAAAKPARLLKVPDVAKALISLVKEQAKAAPISVGVFVNRVRSAHEIYEHVRTALPDVNCELVIGAMRPIDRDVQATRLAPRIGPNRPETTAHTNITIATQCLEVGADYDFDVLLTECASLDALRQRLGRLNRKGRAIQAQAVIVIKEKDIKAEAALDDEKPLDPVYGNAAVRTWNWLWEHAQLDQVPDHSGEKPIKGKAKALAESRTLDFGIQAFQALLDEKLPDPRACRELLAPSAKAPAPVLMPAYVDAWCQTSPKPALEADVSLFLHGEQDREPDVQICWRADLTENQTGNRETWCEIVALMPPTSAECISVPISQARRWLNAAPDDPMDSDASDLLGVARTPVEEHDKHEKANNSPLLHTGVLWRGASHSTLLTTANDLKPGDTLVLPVQAGHKNLGHIPQTTNSATSQAPSIDVAEAAFVQARDRISVRLHPTLFPNLVPGSPVHTLLERIADTDEPPTSKELQQLLREAAQTLSDEPGRQRERWTALSKKFIREPYPDRRGLVLTATERLETQTNWFLPSIDDGDDDASQVVRSSVTLVDHTNHVCQAVQRATSQLSTGVPYHVYQLAALRHDWGKADERFQALLRGTNRTDSWLFAGRQPVLLAKSDTRRSAGPRNNPLQFGLPSGFRHEMLSVALAERCGLPKLEPHEQQLTLHLIAAHHGYARPFAPVVLDNQPPEVEHEAILLTTNDRLENPAHRLDSGIGQRFWSLTKQYGWWGLAYLEAILRLADQQASADEDAGNLSRLQSAEPALKTIGAQA